MLYLSDFSISLNQIKSPRNPSFSSHLPPLPPECTQPPNKFPFLGNGCACRPVAWLQGDLLVPPSGSAQGLEKCGSPFSLESLTDVLDVMSNHHGRARPAIPYLFPPSPGVNEVRPCLLPSDTDSVSLSPPSSSV